jgi:DNA-binding MarR family transcriptional regulator
VTSAADPSAVPLDDRLCLALYNASRAMTARYRPLLEALGLTYPQYLVMGVLWEDGPSTVGGIGERLRLDSGTLTPLLRRLVRAGLVTRRRDSGDERSVIVALTRRGRTLRRRAASVPSAINDASGLAPEERASLVASLRELVAQLSR